MDTIALPCVRSTLILDNVPGVNAFHSGGPGFSPRLDFLEYFGFLSQYHSTKVQYPFRHQTPTLYDPSN